MTLLLVVEEKLELMNTILHIQLIIESCYLSLLDVVIRNIIWKNWDITLKSFELELFMAYETSLEIRF